jgi:hypothetical protein
MWAVQVGEDKFSYYVRMTAVNRTKRPYRITTPSVSHIIPAFGAKITVKSVNQQLTPKQFSQIKLYDSVGRCKPWVDFDVARPRAKRVRDLGYGCQQSRPPGGHLPVQSSARWQEARSSGGDLLTRH